MNTSRHHLAAFADLIDAAGRACPSFGERSLDATEVRALLGFRLPETPLEIRSEGTWTSDGVDGEGLSWSVGYGPRTEAWLLRPAGRREPLPGILALHGHDGSSCSARRRSPTAPPGGIRP